MQRLSPSPGAEGELFLKDRILKEYKIFRTNVVSEIHKLRVCFRSNFREAIVIYLDSLEEGLPECKKFSYQTIVKTYEMLLELSLRTVVVPMLINMIFRNGFPKLPALEIIDTKQYEIEIREFDDACIKKYNTILQTLELNIDNEWFDFSIDPSIFKKFYHTTNTKYVDNTCKETLYFFRTIIRQRDEIIHIIYKDFPKLFNDFEKCQKFVEMYLREIYE